MKGESGLKKGSSRKDGSPLMVSQRFEALCLILELFVFTGLESTVQAFRLSNQVARVSLHRILRKTLRF
jgi:hypothetical protein